MKWIHENEGNILVTFLAAIFGVFLGIFVYGMNHKAEAVLGGVGNLTALSNPHNLAANSSGIHAVGETEICIFCHTPHSALQNATLINGPLWNHKLSEATYTVKNATMYINATIGNINLLSTVPDRPDGSSRMCLSCHDGTVGIGETVMRGPIAMAADACLTSGKLASGCSSYIGTDLTTKHVVSIPMNLLLLTNSALNCYLGGQTTKVEYPYTAGAEQQLNVHLRPTSYMYGGNPGIRVGDVNGPTVSGYVSGYAYGVQCSTCHDPHYWADTTNPQAEGYKFLVTGFDNLCSSCHRPCP